jgi:hypothetical protein
VIGILSLRGGRLGHGESPENRDGGRRANKPDSEALSTAVNQLRRLHVQLMGAVMNSVPTGRSSGFSYYPSYYPSHTTEVANEDKPEERPLLRSGRGQKAG